ncbi:MAG: beta-glucuronidase [Promethearchaeota archaeon]|nr:MAG: beta-glucuronidase [Candidatus Lokiarchaeota archaeon]
MLYPQRNKFRQYVDLSGFWDFRFDPDNNGLRENWQTGFDKSQPIAVPASWNDQFADNRDFLGPAWYQTYFDLPWGWKDQNVFLRFGSINYIADVWLNGNQLGQHEGGHLPFEFNITSKLKAQNNHLIVRVDGNLADDRVPPGGRPMFYPATNFDFFPYCGIHRPVLLYTIPYDGIEDITVLTFIEGDKGKIQVIVKCAAKSTLTVNINIKGHGFDFSKMTIMEDKPAEIMMEIPNAALWDPEQPSLYDLAVELLKNEVIFDSYHLKAGIRTIEVQGDKLLLNGKPIELKGFAKHIDFPVTGRGYVPAVIIKDYSLMKWIGANSFRTSHYPYSEQMMDLADQLGFLVIDETPAVGLTFHKDHIDKHLVLCKQYTRELIARDKNHPSIIMWSLANEPHSSTKSKAFFRELYDLSKELDPTRLVTIINMQGVRDRAFEFLDIVCMNRYFAWYIGPGLIDEGCEGLSRELEMFHQKYAKPIILAEFGADTLPGWHAQPPEMFSEEYQVEFLKKYIEVVNNKPFVIGHHIWNMCDFKTPQGIHRVGAYNYKGVFTRDRRPKMAAHFLKELWNQSKSKKK